MVSGTGERGEERERGVEREREGRRMKRKGIERRTREEGGGSEV